LEGGGEGVERPEALGKGNAALVGDVGRWKEDLENGLLERGWQEQAAEAMEMRGEGVFDTWKEGRTERYWGQKMGGTGDGKGV
jgi:hypothetical protein